MISDNTVRGGRSAQILSLKVQKVKIWIEDITKYTIMKRMWRNNNYDVMISGVLSSGCFDY